MSIDKHFFPLRAYFLKQAKALLEEFNEFFPFAAGLKNDSEVVPVSTYFGEEYPTSPDVIKHLEDALRVSFKGKRFVSVAICSDVLINHPDTNERMDAIEIRYQNKNCEKFNVYFPYKKNGNLAEFIDEYRDVGTLDLLN